MPVLPDVLLTANVIFRAVDQVVVEVTARVEAVAVARTVPEATDNEPKQPKSPVFVFDSPVHKRRWMVCFSFSCLRIYVMIFGQY